MISNQRQATSNKQRASSSKFLFWLYVLFVAYGATMPLQPDFTRSGMMHRWKHAELVPFLNSEGHRLSLGDAAGNILFFVPFGFFLHTWRQSRRLPETSGSVRTQAGISSSLLAALFFSSAIEFCQLFLDGRVTSVNDVVNNLVGTFIGIWLARAHPGLVGTGWEKLKRMTRARPLWALWLATMALQTIIALAPFDFTLKMENFQRQCLRWEYSWNELPSFWQVSSSVRDFLIRFPHHRYMLVTLMMSGGCGILLGALLVYCFHQYRADSAWVIWGLTWVTLGFYPTLALLQFTVQSVYPFVLFPIAGIGSILMGVLLMFIWLWLAARSPIASNFLSGTKKFE